MSKTLQRSIWLALVLLLAAALLLAFAPTAKAAEAGTLKELQKALEDGEIEITLTQAIALPAGTTTLSSTKGATIRSADDERHFVASDNDARRLELFNVTLQGGEQSGGIACFKDLEIIGGIDDRGRPNATITSCVWELSGQCTGGVHVAQGNLTIKNCIVSNNSATMISNSQGFGGGVAAAKGWVYIKNCIIKGNEVSSSGSQKARGGGVFGYGVTVVDSEISGNTAKSGGGGIYGESEESPNETIVTVTNSIISNNTANGRGGGIYAHDIVISDSKVFGNTAALDGGGLCSTSFGMTVTDCEIYGNEAVNGGGIATRPVASAPANKEDTLVISGSKIYDNTATGDGGGVWLSIGGTSEWIAKGAQIQLDLASIDTNNTFSGNKSQKAYENTEHTAGAPYSFGLQSLFNGYDVYPVPSQTEAKFVEVTVNYYQGQTPLGSEYFERAHTGSLAEADVAAVLGEDWLNAERPASGYSSGAVDVELPATIADGQTEIVINVVYTATATDDPGTPTRTRTEEEEIPLGPPLAPPSTGDANEVWLGWCLIVLSLLLGAAVVRFRRNANSV